MPEALPVVVANATIVDVACPEPRAGQHILMQDGRIKKISDSPIALAEATTIDVGGRYVMPGLIDSHVHVTAAHVSLGASAMLPDSYVALQSASIMKGMLDRGFTTVRDLGGADHGLVRAIEEGVIDGPRLFMCGKALSQTGGHGDFRGRYDERPGAYYGRKLGSIARIADGVEALRLACREEIKSGATFIKLMANGGVASPTDPIGFLGYSREEIAAAVEEAENAQTYVAAHLYTDQAIRRAVELGVKCVEHANLVEPPTAELMAKQGVYACPTLITYDALRRQGREFGFPEDSLLKIEDVRERGFEAVRILHEAGVKLLYGTDLLGPLHDHQAEGFMLMAKILSPTEIIRSATSTPAEMLGMSGKIGCLSEGAYADMIVLAANPLEDIGVLSNTQETALLVMKEGRIVKNRLH